MRFKNHRCWHAKDVHIISTSQGLVKQYDKDSVQLRDLPSKPSPLQIRCSAPKNKRLRSLHTKHEAAIINICGQLVIITPRCFEYFQISFLIRLLQCLNVFTDWWNHITWRRTWRRRDIQHSNSLNTFTSLIHVTSHQGLDTSINIKQDSLTKVASYSMPAISYNWYAQQYIKNLDMEQPHLQIRNNIRVKRMLLPIRHILYTQV